MMSSCTECATKHLSTAAAFIREANNGYPDHRLWAIGELVQAEFELMDDYPVLAQRVRAERLLWRGSRHDPKEYNIPFMELMQEIQTHGDMGIVVDIRDDQPFPGTQATQAEIDALYAGVRTRPEDMPPGFPHAAVNVTLPASLDSFSPPH